ncbi:hypothetical protein ACXYTJ_00410 [Gilvimarinus sp. F26214L]|uniref:hypothetical protein n=1 Tax=Gilvimarinus sp. DZF01 TaxID=3461371 RepID=UPI0040462C85
MSQPQAQSRVVITAVDAITPIGANVEQTCAAVKAGVNAFTEYPYLSCKPHDPEWEEPLPMHVAAVPAVDPSIAGLERFIQLAIPPLAAVLGKARLTRQSLARTGLLVALPQTDAATLPMQLGRDLLPLLCKRTGLGLKLARTTLEGRTGIISQLAKATELLQSGELDGCIVGGVDSYLIQDRLRLLDEQWRLKSARNVDGFTPGEAGAMLFLETEAGALARGAKPLAVIGCTGSGVEPETLSSDKVSTGQGLTDAIRSVWENTAPAQRVYCDFNGESYFAFELGLIMSRLAAIVGDSETLCHPADCFGDVGAAVGGLLAASAIHDLEKQGDKARAVLIWTTADGGSRTALRLEPAAKSPN